MLSVIGDEHDVLGRAPFIDKAITVIVLAIANLLFRFMTYGFKATLWVELSSGAYANAAPREGACAALVNEAVAVIVHTITAERVITAV